MTRSSGQLITSRDIDQTCTTDDCTYAGYTETVIDPETRTAWWVCSVGHEHLEDW